MGCSGVYTKNNDYIDLLWIDTNINKNQFNEYFSNLEINQIKEVKKFETVEIAIEELKKIHFSPTIVICSLQLFQEFLSSFKEKINEINICPKIILFSEGSFSSSIEYKRDLLIKEQFYNSEGVLNDFNNLLDIIKVFKSKFNVLYRQKTKKNIDDNKEYSIEYINNKNQLILPKDLANYLKPIEEEKIKLFNQSICIKFKKSGVYSLFEQLQSCNDIPNEIVSKYWIKSYINDSAFNDYINKDLTKGKNSQNLIYIQMMYEGIKIKSISLQTQNSIYSGAYVNVNDLKKLEFILYNNKEISNSNLPIAFIYNKEFISFYENKNKAEENKKNVLLILNNSRPDLNLGMASLKGFTDNKNEDQILVFPYQCFIIKSFQKKGDNDYEIILEYLDDYKDLFEGKKEEELFKDIPNDSQYAKTIFDLNIIDEGHENELGKIVNKKNIKKIRQSEIKFDEKSEKLSDSDDDPGIKNVKNENNIIDKANIFGNQNNDKDKDKEFDLNEIINNKERYINQKDIYKSKNDIPFYDGDISGEANNNDEQD